MPRLRFEWPLQGYSMVMVVVVVGGVSSEQPGFHVLSAWVRLGTLFLGEKKLSKKKVFLVV